MLPGQRPQLLRLDLVHGLASARLQLGVSMYWALTLAMMLQLQGAVVAHGQPHGRGRSGLQFTHLFYSCL